MVNSSKTLPWRPSGDVEHNIVTKGPPLSCHFRHLDGKKLAAAKKEFLQMERVGIIRRSDSPWSSPLHMERKPDGSWQTCGDYRRLNLVTVPDSYPLPNMLDFLERIAGCKIFSKVDLRKGYHQILMHPADIPKTAIATLFGLFKFLRMTFGLRNAGNTFQHREKCVFGVEEVEFLGHHVNTRGGGTHRQPRRRHPGASAAHNSEGVASRFMPAPARILKPLTDQLKGNPKPAAAIRWTAEMQAAILAAKAYRYKSKDNLNGFM